MNKKASSPVFIYDEEEIAYKFNEDHPFNQDRLTMTVDLLRKAGALPDRAIRKPRPATDNELLRVHSQAYIDAVKGLSCPVPEERFVQAASRFGLDTDDTPYFAGMHDITAEVVGGSITAVDLVMSGAAPHALHLGGGLHHALQSKGAGFCVYNDASAAIAHAQETYGAKVLYVDTDVHHGDGVQWTFYADPLVCTLSIHETGKFLFPGTGAVNERGEGDAFGTNINIPVEPYTEDDSWLECFSEVLTATIARFQPDIIISQHGCDAHALDPLAHVHCSMRVYKAMPELIHALAHQWCAGRWVALGGGGYDIWRVVPRAWSLLWLVMSEQAHLDQLEAQPQLALPQTWLDAWQSKSPVHLPATWLDPVEDWAPIPRREAIAEKNRHTKELAMMYLK
ncbi:acetoin utilization protein AcuC [Paenibacillus marchantiophytorum]|uniref:Acetoin utilization protein AcuC n=1 Tax=Paenibacillus marchantiophytorum TaxID=1619310 RepID=A0ABQ2BQ19_9BACL|nr:acetoin utilization protein AcuC [Paenibacillus marchantiophytorum]GGI43070.1 acetoin utilization protein AcuC [Paenibacillus marchantiophytorum]